MAVKKAFQEIINLLTANQSVTVSEILDQAIELASSKGRGATGGTTVHRDDNGNVVAIKCYYFKKWMPLSHVEFGAKASSASGYNSMCKEGVSKWTKQQSAFRKADQELLEKLMAGDITPEEAQELREANEAERDMIVPHSQGIGFDTIDELLDTDPSVLDDLVAEAKEEAA